MDVAQIAPTAQRKCLAEWPCLAKWPCGVSRIANWLCETVIRLSTRLGLIEVFLNHASQVGKQAVALPPV
jgi:hypothetical protein